MLYPVIRYQSDSLPVKVGVTYTRYKCVFEYFDSIMSCGRDRYIQVSEKIKLVISVMKTYENRSDFSIL